MSKSLKKTKSFQRFFITTRMESEARGLLVKNHSTEAQRARSRLKANKAYKNPEVEFPFL